MYIITLYNKDFTTTYTKILHGNDFIDLSYTQELMRSGGFKFKMELRNPKASPINLQLFNKVLLSKNGVDIMLGYIEGLSMDTNTIDVSCVGILGIFDKRIVTQNFVAASLPTSFFALLTNTNAVNDTGITVGSTDVVFTLNDVSLSRSSLLSAWEKFANLASCEFTINPNRTLDLKTQLGTDKSATVVLRYRVTQISASTIRQFSVDVEGRDTLNSVTGVGSASLISVQNDAPSIADFGLLEGTNSFTQTANQVDLDNETTKYVANHKKAFYNPKIVVDTDKIDTDSLSVGDTVRVELDNGFIFLVENQRVLRKSVTVTNNLGEQVELEVSNTGVNILSTDPFETTINLNDRVRLLESTL